MCRATRISYTRSVPVTVLRPTCMSARVAFTTPREVHACSWTGQDTAAQEAEETARGHDGRSRGRGILTPSRWPRSPGSYPLQCGPKRRPRWQEGPDSGRGGPTALRTPQRPRLEWTGTSVPAHLEAQPRAGILFFHQRKWPSQKEPHLAGEIHPIESCRPSCYNSNSDVDFNSYLHNYFELRKAHKCVYSETTTQKDPAREMFRETWGL